MSRNLDVVLVGIGGYGVLYVREMLSRAHLEGATLVGVVDPNPQACPRLGELEAAGTGHIRARFKSGETVDYGNPFAQDGRKLWLTLQAIRNGGGVPCGLEAAASHTACMDAVHAMFPEVPTFPDDWVVRDADKGMTYVKGLAGQLNDCYDNWRLPSQNGAPWAVPAIAGTVEQPVLRWR
jgi:hypothetical protein